MRKIKLRGCPWCGRAPAVAPVKYGHFPWAIICDWCNLAMKGDDIDDLVTYWNIRKDHGHD